MGREFSDEHIRQDVARIRREVVAVLEGPGTRDEKEAVLLGATFTLALYLLDAWVGLTGE